MQINEVRDAWIVARLAQLCAGIPSGGFTKDRKDPTLSAEGIETVQIDSC